MIVVDVSDKIPDRNAESAINKSFRDRGFQWRLRGHNILDKSTNRAARYLPLMVRATSDGETPAAFMAATRKMKFPAFVGVPLTSPVFVS